MSNLEKLMKSWNPQ